MELGDYNYEKPELLTVTEKIYELKGKLSSLRLELEDEEFHAKYIPIREKNLASKSRSNMAVILPLTLFVLLCLIAVVASLVSYRTDGNSIVGLFTLAGGIGLLAGGFLDFKLIRTEIAISRVLKKSKKEDKALSYARKKDITTIQSDRIASREHLETLRLQIDALEHELKKAQERQSELLSHKESAEEIMRRQGVLFDEKPETEDGSGLSLKGDGTASLDIAELDEIYSKEERHLSENIRDLEVNLEQLNRRIIEIDDGYQAAKHKLLAGGLIFALMVFFQMPFTGMLGNVTSLICLFVSVGGILYLDKSCTSDIFAYLIEHDSRITQEYVFINDIEPVYKKRERVIRLIEENQLEIEDIKMKRDALDM